MANESLPLLDLATLEDFSETVYAYGVRVPDAGAAGDRKIALGSAAAAALSALATAAQGGKADTAVQPGAPLIEALTGLAPEQMLEVLDWLLTGVVGIVHRDAEGAVTGIPTDPDDPATPAELLEGVEDLRVDPAALKAVRAWTPLAIEAGEAIVPWGEPLPRVIEADDDFDLGFPFPGEDFFGQHLASRVLVVNATSGPATVDTGILAGNGTTLAHVVLPEGETSLPTIPAIAGAGLLLSYELLPDGRVTVTSWGLLPAPV